MIVRQSYKVIALILVSVITFVSIISVHKNNIEEDSDTPIKITEGDESQNITSALLGNNNSQLLEGYSNADSDGYNSSDSGRLDDYESKYIILKIGADMLAKQKARDSQLKELRKKWKMVDSTNLKFNSCYSNEFKEVNTALYSIANRYFSPITFADTSYKDYVDPLYILAISNVEFGDETSPDILLAPAISTTRGIKVTKDNILTFGYSDYLKYPNVLSSDRDSYRGPLQIYVTGLTEAIKPSDLLSCEYIQLMNAPESTGKSQESSSLEYVEGSGTTAFVDGMVLSNKPGVYGDRWNYSDAVNRLAGTVHANWLRYQKNSQATKTGNYAIDSRYAWMAMSAIGHNASPGIYYMGDNVDIGNSYFWWPFGPYKNARMYAHFLGIQSSVTYIKNVADNNLNEYRNNKGTLKFRLSRQEGCKIADELVAKNIIPSGLWKNTSWNNEEKIAYPVQVLYNYFLLEDIYNGS